MPETGLFALFPPRKPQDLAVLLEGGNTAYSEQNTTKSSGFP